MEGKFTHYLITRYNVRLEHWDRDLSGSHTRDDDWMKHREILFRQYCFPSVAGQTTQHFTWLLYFQEGTSEQWLQPIRELTRSFPHISLRMVDGYHGCMQDIDQHMQQAGTPFLITSRLDNDDALAKNFIATVQQHFVPQHHVLINLTEGMGYQPHARVATRLKKMQLNSFSSYIEAHRPAGGHTSVRGFQHGAPPEGCDIRNVATPPVWLKIFHDRNLKSTAFGFPVFSGSWSSLFGLEPSVTRIHLGHTLIYTLRWLFTGLIRKTIGSR